MGFLAGAGAGMIGTGILYQLKDDFTVTSKKIRAEYKNLDSTSRKVVKNLNKGARQINKHVKNVMLGAGMAAMLAMPLKVSGEFGAKISEVGAKARATSSQLKTLESEALRLGEATKFSAIQVAEGQSFLAMAGYRSNQIVQAMPGLLNLAAAGNIDLAKASDIASNVLAQYGMTAKDTAKVSDLLALTTVSANTNMEQLADAFKYLGPTANALGVSIEESAAGIMALSNAGLQGSLGTRALSTAFARLADPTKKMQTKMNQLGLSFWDANENFIGINKTVEILEDRFKNLSKKQRMAAISAIFGGEAIQEMSTFLTSQTEVLTENGVQMMKGSQALRYFTEQNKNAGGVAKKIADQMMDNYQGSVTVMKSTWETFMIRLGKAIEPVAGVIVKAITGIVKVFSWFASTWAGKAMIGVIAATTALFTAISAVKLAIAGFKSVTLMGILSLSKLGLAEVITTFTTKGLAAGFTHLATAVWAAMAPMLPMIAGIAAVAAIVYLGARSVKEFNKVMEGTEKPANGFKGFMQRTGGVLTGMVAIWKSATDEGFSLSRKMRDTFKDLGILDLVLSIGTYIVRLKSFIKGFVGVVKGAFKGVWDDIKSIFSPFITLLDSLGINLDKAFGKVSVFNKAGKILGFVFKYIVLGPLRIVISTIKKAIAAGSFLIKGLVWLFSGNWAEKGSFGQRIGESIKKDFFNSINWLKNKFRLFTDDLKLIGKSFGQSIFDGVKSIWQTMIQWMKDGFNSVKSFLGIETDQPKTERARNYEPMNITKEHSILKYNSNTVNQTEKETLKESNTVEVLKTIQLNLDSRPLYNKFSLLNEEEMLRE